jgi:superfamily I DNA/RNA helicase
VEGNNGKAILALLAKWGEDITWGSFVTRLEDYVERETAKLERKKKFEKIEYLQEKSAIIMDIADNPLPSDKMSTIIARAERLFGKGQENADILRLCTVHRSKGREWDRVRLLGPERYMPSPYAKSEEDIKAEANIHYVAITRAKRVLVNVEVMTQKEEKEAEVSGWWELEL